jgi:sugar phosphate isomerase/epimerase
MPFEGNLDYQKVIKKLDEYNYTGSLILEVFNGKYPDMTAEDFLAWAYERLKRISDMSTLMQ